MSKARPLLANVTPKGGAPAPRSPRPGPIFTDDALLAEAIDRAKSNAAFARALVDAVALLALQMPGLRKRFRDTKNAKGGQRPHSLWFLMLLDAERRVRRVKKPKRISAKLSARLHQKSEPTIKRLRSRASKLAK